MRKHAYAEALEKIARRIELKDGWVRLSTIHAGGVAVGLIVETAVKHPDVAVRSHMHPDDLSPLASTRTLHACGKGRPVRRETIRVWQIGFGDACIAWSLRIRDHGQRQDKYGLDDEAHAVAIWSHHCGLQPECQAEVDEKGNPTFSGLSCHPRASPSADHYDRCARWDG